MHRVMITGLGTVSALGGGSDAFWRALQAGRSAIEPLRGFDECGLKETPGAVAVDFDPADHFDAAQQPLLDRHAAFAVVAAREAVADAGLDDGRLEQAAAVIGTGCGGKETDEITYRRLYRERRPRVHPMTIPRGMPSAAASQVSMQLGIAGPVFSVSSACASANHAIAQAAAMIRSGLVELAVAGGSDAPFTCGLMKAWESLRVMSRDTCRPFSADRSGLVLGEGAGMVVLESRAHARRRGVSPYAELAGIGLSADAGHITAPSVDGAVRAIRSALADAGEPPERIDYVNAHGTGTQINDPTESEALRAVFGEHAARLAVSSTKSMHGHALGAAGGLELAATLLAMRHGVVPPTANFTTAGEGCDLDYVPNEARPLDLRCAISNSFAFGGLNAVLLVRRV